MDKVEFDKLPPDEQAATRKFFAASITHELEQLKQARLTVVRLEEKLEKMKAYAELIVGDTEEALRNARADVEVVEQRWNVAKGLQWVVSDGVE
jgi:hypothetical protein